MVFFHHGNFGKQAKKCVDPCEYIPVSINQRQEIQERKGSNIASLDADRNSYQSIQQSNFTQSNTKRLMIKDKGSGIQFLIDTGSDVSILPCKSKSKQPT